MKERIRINTEYFDAEDGQKEVNLVEYQNFWHWIIRENEINNGGYFYLDTRPLSDYAEKHWHENPAFVNEILALIDKEFPEADGEMYFYVSW